MWLSIISVIDLVYGWGFEQLGLVECDDAQDGWNYMNFKVKFCDSVLWDKIHKEQFVNPGRGPDHEICLEQHWDNQCHSS